jgi:hypothetical protein
MPDIIQEIDKALEAHRLWRAQLKEAIKNRKMEKPIETIRTNNACAFGKWLYGSEITTDQKASKYYKTITDLHTQFHKLAAQVAELAVAGKTEEAENLLSTKGAYMETSARLSSALTDWKKAVNAVPVK